MRSTSLYRLRNLRTDDHVCFASTRVSASYDSDLSLNLAQTPALTVALTSAWIRVLFRDAFVEILERKFSSVVAFVSRAQEYTVYIIDTSRLRRLQRIANRGQGIGNVDKQSGQVPRAEARSSTIAGVGSALGSILEPECFDRWTRCVPSHR